MGQRGRIYRGFPSFRLLTGVFWHLTVVVLGRSSKISSVSSSEVLANSNRSAEFVQFKLCGFVLATGAGSNPSTMIDWQSHSIDGQSAGVQLFSAAESRVFSGLFKPWPHLGPATLKITGREEKSVRGISRQSPQHESITDAASKQRPRSLESTNSALRLLEGKREIVAWACPETAASHTESTVCKIRALLIFVSFLETCRGTACSPLFGHRAVVLLMAPKGGASPAPTAAPGNSPLLVSAPRGVPTLFTAA